MSKDQIIDSLGRIDEEIIHKVAKERTRKRPKIVLRRWFSLAACFALIFSVALTAEATNGSVSNLLAPLFGGAQTEIVNEIGIPAGASVSVNGYTLTADAIIGDRYRYAVVYTLSRDDGQPVPDNVKFLNWNPGRFGSGGGTLTAGIRDENDPNVVHFVEDMHGQSPVIGRIITTSFSTLGIHNKDGDDTIIAEGTWELTYTLRYEDSSEKIPVRDLYVTDEGGQYYKVRKILLSPVGIHFDLLLYDPDFTDGIFRDFKVTLLLTDGTELPLEGGGGGKYTEGDKSAKVSYYARFDTPVPRGDIEAIIICGTVFDISASD